MTEKMTGQEIAKLILDQSNQYGSIRRGGIGVEMAEAILAEHRTLQQATIGILFKVLIEIGKAIEPGPMTTDLRNQAAIEACVRLVELEEAGEINTRFPFV